MVATDLSHATNLMTYPDMREDNIAIGPHGLQLHCRPSPSPMEFCSNRLLGLKDVLHEADCGVRPRVNPKVQKVWCALHQH